MSLTVVGVCREMRVEIDPSLTWSVGARVRELYRDRFGHLPPKELRSKTAGGGSHCFAVYPDEMRQDIERVIRDHNAEAAKQLALGF